MQWQVLYFTALDYLLRARVRPSVEARTGGTYGLGRTGAHGSLPGPGLKQQAGGVVA